ncbi:MAG: YiiX/YebB-like N1pC/P60 family cysteine hydrolase [Candidatus Brocadiaceae bacterium]
MWEGIPIATAKFNKVSACHYEDIKKEIKAGDILFCSGKYIFSKVIRYLSDSLFTHVGIVFPWQDQIMVLESEVLIGVRVVTLSNYLKNYNNTNRPYKGDLYLGRHNATVDQKRALSLVKHASTMLSRKYDTMELAQIVLRLIAKTGKHKENDAYICSDFVTACFEQIGVQFSKDEKGFIFPEHIASDPNVTPLFKITD